MSNETHIGIQPERLQCIVQTYAVHKIGACDYIFASPTQTWRLRIDRGWRVRCNLMKDSTQLCDMGKKCEAKMDDFVQRVRSAASALLRSQGFVKEESVYNDLLSVGWNKPLPQREPQAEDMLALLVSQLPPTSS